MFILNSKLKDGFLEMDIAGTHEINWNLAGTHRYNVTANVVLTEINIPTTTKESAMLIAMIRGTGFSVQVPARWIIKDGDYGDGSVEKQFVVNSFGTTGNVTFINDI